MASLPKLLSPLQLGDVQIPNRVLMAPLTRVRATEAHVPTSLMAEYYGQRASAGLIIAEATAVCDGASAFGNEPGIHNGAQVAGWAKVTDAVHAQGGRIFLQLWHGGRACHPQLNGGALGVAPSPIAITGNKAALPTGELEHQAPRELSLAEITGVMHAFRSAAANAKQAGFDGVEVHGANGYLLDAFLRSSANQRTDNYGGAVENRARLLLEVVEACCEVWGGGRVGVRVSPLNSYNSMKDDSPVETYSFLAERLNTYKLAYLHMMRADFFKAQKGDVLTPIRAAYKGNLVGNMGYTGEEAEAAIVEGKLDAVAFGTSFLANPDLPERLSQGAPLHKPDSSKFYTAGPAGYTDYPTMVKA
jgi:N-ethylmaleimide reductase